MKTEPAIIIFIILLSVFCFGQNLQYVNSMLYSGPVRCLEVRGGMAYCGCDKAFQIFSLADPQQARPYGGYPLRGEPKDIVLHDHYAIVGDGGFGIVIFDIINPASPQPIAELPITGTQVRQMCLSGDYLFLTALVWGGNRNGIYIINLTDIENPIQIDYLDLPGREHGIAIQDTFTYVTGFDYGLHVLNISDPEDVYRAGGLNDPSILGEISVWNDKIVTSSKLSIVDMSDPVAPTLISQLDNYAGAELVEIKDSAAYLGLGNNVIVYDITDPYDVDIIGIIDSEDIFDIAIAESLLVVGNESVGLQFYSSINPAQPYFIGGYKMPGNPLQCAVCEDKAFITTGGGGLEIVDISDLNLPLRFGYHFNAEPAYPVDADADYAYIGDGEHFFRMIDYSDPFNPLPVNLINTQGNISAIKVRGNYAYLQGSQELQIFDISDPDDVNLAGQNTDGNGASQIFLDGNYLYTGSMGGFQAYDISDPYNPVFLAGLYLFETGDVCVNGDYAYMTNMDPWYPEQTGLRIADISNPGQPAFVGFYDTPENCFAVAAYSHYALVARPDSGIYIFDVIDPAGPLLITTAKTIGRIQKMHVFGDYLFANDGSCYQIYQFDFSGIENDPNPLPQSNFLVRNYPNPFNAKTTISYEVPIAANVRIDIFDILGRNLETVIDSHHLPGSYNLTWDAAGLSSGIYFYKIQAGGYSETDRCLLLK